MNTLYDILRYIIIGKSGFVFEIAVCEILFASGSKFRKWPWLTVPAAIAAHLTFGLLVPYFERVTLVIFVLSVLLQFAVLKQPFHRVVFNSVSAYATQNLAVNVFDFIRLLTKLTGWGMLLVKYAVDAAIYAACYFIFARKNRRTELHINYIYLGVVCVLTLLITNVLGWYLTKAVGMRYETLITLTVCCIGSLMLLNSALYRGKASFEKATLERLLHMEQKQHEITQESIEIINYKCHDLKKQIAALKDMFGDEVAAEIFGEAEKAVQIYDSSINTGNKNLDLIINEEKLFCDKYGISLDIMADGSLLSFMVPADIYSLFGNALRNAVESVMDEEQRYRTISLNVHRNGAYLVIEIKNFCTRPVEFKKGKPVTWKADKQFHGYGIKSMEYIVEKYGGNMVIDFKDNTFLVKVLIKLPS